jgi:hypothetical protein
MKRAVVKGFFPNFNRELCTLSSSYKEKNHKEYNHNT